MGAPYDGSGRVYVYCGSSDGIDKKPAQVRSGVGLVMERSQFKPVVGSMQMARTDLDIVLSHCDIFRSSRQDPKTTCLDILCRATWTWMTISTRIWLWGLSQILFLFTGDFHRYSTNLLR